MKTKRLSGFAFANVVLCAIFVMTSVAMGKDVHVPSPVPPGEGVLSLDAALQAAYSFNPALLASHHNINIASGHLKQARLLPNPRLAVGISEYDRHGEGMDSSEMEIVFVQPFELGGKRSGRIRMAEADDEIVEFAHESTKRDISAGTKRYFFEVIAAQRRLERAGAAVEMAKKVADAVSERGKAGKETPPQVARLNAVLDVAKMSELDAEMVLSAARRKLSMMWGEASPRFTTAECEFDVVEESLVPLDVLKERLLRNPELLRIESEIRLRRAEVSAEKAERVPDIDAAIGYQSFEEDGSDSYIFAIDVPLPLFNRNQGKISVAIAELAKTETGGLSRKSQLLADLETAFFGLSIAHKRVQLLSSKVIPVMQTARDAVLVGYREGKFELLEVIEAQRSLFEAEGELVNALLAYHIAATEIDRLTYMPEEND